MPQNGAIGKSQLLSVPVYDWGLRKFPNIVTPSITTLDSFSYLM